LTDTEEDKKIIISDSENHRRANDNNPFFFSTDVFSLQRDFALRLALSEIEGLAQGRKNELKIGSWPPESPILLTLIFTKIAGRSKTSVGGGEIE
jgi:hypothetical protein